MLSSKAVIASRIVVASLLVAPLPLRSQEKQPVTQPGTVVAGTTSACALTSAGALYCWGDDPSTALWGRGRPPRTSPVADSGGLAFQAFSIGGDHRCGLTTGGAAICWGNNRLGALGDGTGTYRAGPVTVSGDLVFKAISAGNGYTCGLTTEGDAYCWGGNEYGQLGDSTRTLRRSPVAVSGGGLVFKTITTSANHYTTCGLNRVGTAYCWGYGFSGGLGNGKTKILATSPIRTATFQSFQAISPGSDFTCGIDTNPSGGGAAFCWGRNVEGQLGLGGTTWHGPPGNPAFPGLVSEVLRFVAISAGHKHACGLEADGTAYCWGSNSRGQLGDGTLTQRGGPVRVSSALVFKAISAGLDFTCGLTTDGAAYCWGANDVAQLGDGTRKDRASPVAVLGGLVF